jgi:uncharacterized membrane protein YdbT with pleckstrin-like domain
LLFWGFVLTLREDVFVRRFGLFTHRAHALPRRKIQRVLVDQPLLRLWLDRATVKADSAGGIAGDNERTKGGTDVISPLLPLADAGRLVGWLMPGFDLAASGWRGVSNLLVVRVTILAALLALVGVFALAGPLGLWALVALVIVPLGASAGYLMWRRAGYALRSDHLALRYGMLGRTYAVVPLRKVQAVVLRAGPLDRMLRLARVVVYVAGGSPTTLAHLAREDADHLLGQIGREAGRTKFVW